MIIALDFDNTVVESEYPDIGQAVPHAIEVLKKLQNRGDKIHLYTCRGGFELMEAAYYLKKNGINLVGTNKKNDLSGTKLLFDISIDDRNLGCPMCQPDGFTQKVVDWLKVAEILNVK